MPEWFAAKRFGLGAGLPIAWQGWVATLMYVAIVVGSAFLLGERSPWAVVSIVLTATAIFLVIAARTTQGGWRWRWGGEE